MRAPKNRLLTLPVLAAVLGAGCGSSSLPEEAASQKAFGARMAREGFWREALFRFERAASVAPDDAEVQNNLAVACEAVGETARALAAYKRAIELAPGDTRIKRNYSRFAEYYTALQRAGGTTPGGAEVSPGRSVPGAARPALLAAVLAVAAALGMAVPPDAWAGAREVKLRLPLRPKLAVTGRERITLAPFIVASSLSERKDASRLAKEIDLDGEFRRYFAKQLSKRTKMAVIAAPSDLKLPTQSLKELGEAAEFWKGFGTRTGVDLVLSGIVDFKVEEKSGFKTEEYVSRLDGRTYYRQVLVETTGFTFEVTVLALDGKTGARLFQETFRDSKEKQRRAADEMVGLFENLYSLENQLLGLFVVREREANRYVFD